MAFEDHLSGKRMLDVLGKRLGRYGLRLNPIKTRFVDFRFRRPGGRHPATVGTTFGFLGFTHVWGHSRNGKNVVRQITAKDRYARALASVTEWCRRNLHHPFREQHAHLSRMIRGHCAYYGITGNSRRIRVVPPPAHADMEEMARSARPPQQSAVAALSGHARSVSPAARLDCPPVHRCLSEACARRTGCG
jgi:hypothetical protein